MSPKRTNLEGKPKNRKGNVWAGEWAFFIKKPSLLIWLKQGWEVNPIIPVPYNVPFSAVCLCLNPEYVWFHYLFGSVDYFALAAGITGFYLWL